MKLWEKGIDTDQLIGAFTVGKDRDMDLLLARYDITGSMAHAIMLKETGLLTGEELRAIHGELLSIYGKALSGDFVIEPEAEDIHSQVELMLTRKLGETGKKIHTARSRNDQVLLDIKLMVRDELHQLVDLVREFFGILLARSEKYRDMLMPGFTHLQVAMPSSFGLWFGAYAECLAEDLELILAAYRMADLNPLGSAAGFGTSFPIDRRMTTELLGFEDLHYNVIAAQMGRGRTERTTAFALAALAGTLSRMAGDVCLYASQNFNLLKLPDSFTTGSSIMPHKKNPDVFELIRARCNRIQALPGEIDHMILNLPSGYFRDMQIVKEGFLPVFADMKTCLQVASYAIVGVMPVTNTLDDDRYRYIFSVEEVNKLVMQGIPFRDAYKVVAGRIADGSYQSDGRISHTHAGSAGNLCTDQIRQKMENVYARFPFGKKDRALEMLLRPRE